MAENTNFYPHLVVKQPEKPSRLLAFPLLGIIIKALLLIPVWFEIFFLCIAALFVYLINSFYILFTGKYWDTAYNFFLGFARLYTKAYLYILGLTDTYPGFGLDTKGLFELDFAKPHAPNRWLAFPILGLLIRLLILLPFEIFSQVMRNGTSVAVLISWFGVLFTGKFPQSLYEFERDTIRVSNAAAVYLLSLNEKYPSFSISMKHKPVKIFLLITGALLVIFNWLGKSNRANDSAQYSNQNYYQNQNYNLPNNSYPQDESN